MIKRFSFTLTLIFLMLFVSAQNSVAKAEEAREATGMRADGKIYVVIAVLLTILFGLFVYLIRLDRKISRLEKGTSK